MDPKNKEKPEHQIVRDLYFGQRGRSSFVKYEPAVLALLAVKQHAAVVIENMVGTKGKL